MSKIAKIGLIILALAIIAIIAIVYFNNKNKTQNTTPAVVTQPAEEKNLSNIDPQQYASILGTNGSNFKKAQTQALTWKNNAYFSFLQVQIPENLNPKEVTETYVYDSIDSPLMYYTIGFDLEGNFIRALIYKTDYLQDQTPKKINTQYWQVDWITAFQMAEKSGGKEFREKYKNDLSIKANLTYSSINNFLAWTINYTSNNTQDSLTIQVNANTGEIIQEIDTEENQESTSQNS